MVDDRIAVSHFSSNFVAESESQLPWYAKMVMLRPEKIEQNLEQIRASGLYKHVPNSWQLFLGIVRMVHRIVFRSDTVGTSKHFSVRSNWRAKLLHFRPFRFPFLLKERAVYPWDLSGLMCTPEQMMSHLMGAHHDGLQFVYDLQILACYPGSLDKLYHQVLALVHQDTPRHRWLRDLTVYENYHENLLETVKRACQGDFSVPDDVANNPDVTFDAYLKWCSEQPATPEATWSAIQQGSMSWV
jgi:hypothetical protein